jgi:hypothetical protein
MTELRRIEPRWAEGSSPSDVVEAVSGRLLQIRDIVVVARLTDGTRSYWLSSMEDGNAIGMLENAKLQVHEDYGFESTVTPEEDP